MKFIIFITFFISLMSAQTSFIDVKNQKIIMPKVNTNLFITNYEYGQMLYKNPRGIGCIKCHGDDGDGELIARYKDDNGEFIEINAPSITNLSYERFKKVLTQSNNTRSIMPSYFLTNDEMQQIHFYITNKRER